MDAVCQSGDAGRIPLSSFRSLPRSGEDAVTPLREDTSVMIDRRIELLDTVLAEWREAIGADYAGYRNHVYRVVHFCLALHPSTGDARDQIIVSACFHDLGIWSDRTVDYLPPSMERAAAYLRARQLAHWIPDVQAMIEFHHQLTAHQDRLHPVVEHFRQADLIDLSLGLVRCGLSRTYIGQVRAAFPNAGFHRRLARLAVDGFASHPLNPLPFFKW
jgi:hypothetical protein